jgi:hypothetical protein
MAPTKVDIFQPASPQEVENRHKKWVKENPHVGYSGFSGYTGVTGYSGVAGYSGYPEGGTSYARTIARAIDENVLEAIRIPTATAVLKPPPVEFKVKIPKEIYYIFGIVASAGLTLLILSIIEGYLKGR